MKWCRYQVGSHVGYGVVEDDRVIEVTGSPFDEHALTRTSHPLARVRLLPPVWPRVLYAAGPIFCEQLGGIPELRSYPTRRPSDPLREAGPPSARTGPH